jgi:hypothetical protein
LEQDGSRVGGKAVSAVNKRSVRNRCAQGINGNNGNDRDEVVVLAVVLECVKIPKVIIGGGFWTYLI